jgi:hypothetical protein
MTTQIWHNLNIIAVTVPQGDMETVLVLLNAEYCKVFVMSYSTKLRQSVAKPCNYFDSCLCSTAI